MSQRYTELELVRRIRQWTGPTTLTAGIGDDCAIFRPHQGQELLFTTDFLIEDVHFRRDTHPAAAVGHKALARSLSDIAAMAGEPRFCLLSLALAPWADKRWVDGFYRGFLALALKHDVELAGGDLSHARQTVCDVMVCGMAPNGKALRRDTAGPGDRIYVSGPLGRDWRKHLKPNPRIDAGLAIRGKATAAMDLSDGLSIDLARLCEASAVAARLDFIPVRRGATLEMALHAGEDYELLFTMPPRRKPPRGSLAIGEIVAGPAGLVTLHGEPLKPLGYTHF